MRKGDSVHLYDMLSTWSVNVEAPVLLQKRPLSRSPSFGMRFMLSAACMGPRPYIVLVLVLIRHTSCCCHSRYEASADH